MNEKLTAIIKLLLSKTLKREADWGEVEDGFLITINGKSYLTLQQYYNSQSEEFVYIINLYNDNGKKIVYADTSDLFDLNGLSSELYDLVYSQINKVDETLDELLDALNDPKIGKIGDKHFDPEDDGLPF